VVRKNKQHIVFNQKEALQSPKSRLQQTKSL